MRRTPPPRRGRRPRSPRQPAPDATTTLAQPGSIPGGRRTLARILRTAAVLLLTAAMLVVGGLLVVYASLPGVDDAPARVAASAHAHHAQPYHGRLDARVVRALLSVEDRRFHEHGALDVHALLRATAHTVTLQGGDPGGATIAVQLAKVLYHQRTLQAVLMAIKLERRYPKRQLLRFYLNSIYFGHGYWGLHDAAQGYFATPAQRLSWAQATLLAGLPQAPRRRPAHPPRARSRPPTRCPRRAHQIPPDHTQPRRRDHSPAAQPRTPLRPASSPSRHEELAVPPTCAAADLPSPTPRRPEDHGHRHADLDQHRR